MLNKNCKISITWDSIEIEGNKIAIMSMIATLLQELKKKKILDDKDIDSIVKHSKMTEKDMIKEVKKNLKDIFNYVLIDDEEEEEIL